MCFSGKWRLLWQACNGLSNLKYGTSASVNWWELFFNNDRDIFFGIPKTIFSNIFILICRKVATGTFITTTHLSIHRSSLSNFWWKTILHVFGGPHTVLNWLPVIYGWSECSKFSKNFKYWLLSMRLYTAGRFGFLNTNFKSKLKNLTFIYPNNPKSWKIK